MAQMSQMGELALVSGMAELLKEMPHKPGEGKEIQVSEREVLQFLVSFLSFLDCDATLYQRINSVKQTVCQGSA